MKFSFSWPDDSLIAIAVVHGVWLVALLLWALCSIQLETGKFWTRLRTTWSLSGADKARRFNRTDVQDAHLASVQVFLRQRSDALTVGALGLTAWSVFYATDSHSMLHPALRLLLIGVAFNLAGPSLLRTGPSEGSYVALQAFQVVGYSAISLAVISSCAVIFSEGWVSVLADAVGPALVAIELVQVNTERDRVAVFLGKPKAASTAVEPSGVDGVS